ncbi:MAG: CRISPR system precrRNA processing endoribonuclease RAMP protein Cas6 [Oscillatoria sp. SIO1A7]|nr:CRISPR system precrRNA processing endoribonuclease RAMP protein Cas6 [Oscillatoria sp. SIO1A7]
MLIQSTWTLSLSQAAVLPRAYALELAKELHRRMGWQMGEIPDVSYSGILGRRSSSADFITFEANEFYTLSLCGLSAGASKAIAALDLSGGLEFLGAKFATSDRQDQTASYEELYTTLVANEPEPVLRFDLHFASPTAFAQNRNHLPLPVPALIFISWLERWNRFAPIYLGGDELVAYLGDAVSLRRHKIQTRAFPLPRNYINGFVGDVTLQLSYRTDPLLANVANLLVSYSQYAGTGVKTRLGMGHTRV